MPPAGGHKQGIAVLQMAFDAFYPFQRGKSFDIGRFNTIIFQRISGVRNAVEPFFPFVIKQNNVFTAEMGMENVRHVDIVMQKSFRADAAKKHGRIFIEKTAHQFFGEHIIIQQGRSMFDGVKQKNPQIGRFALN